MIKNKISTHFFKSQIRKYTTELRIWGAAMNRRHYIPTFFERFSKLDPIDISCGQLHLCFVTRDGSLYGMGETKRGQCAKQGFLTNLVKMKEGISKVACGKDFTLAVSKDDTQVFATGCNESGQLGIGTIRDQFEFIPMKLPHSKILHVTAGTSHSIIITQEGSVYTCGLNHYGQLGHPELFNEVTPRECNFDRAIKKASAGVSHSVFLSEEGEVFCVGRGYEGQLGSPIKQSPKLVKVPIGEKCVDVQAGSYHSMALTENGNLYCWGNGIGGPFLGQRRNQHVPILIAEKVKQFATKGHHAILQMEDGLYAVGVGGDGQLGIGRKPQESHTKPVKIDDHPNLGIYKLSCGDFTSASIVITQ